MPNEPKSPWNQTCMYVFHYAHIPSIFNFTALYSIRCATYHVWVVLEDMRALMGHDFFTDWTQNSHIQFSLSVCGTKSLKLLATTREPRACRIWTTKLRLAIGVPYWYVCGPEFPHYIDHIRGFHSYSIVAYMKELLFHLSEVPCWPSLGVVQ